MSVRYRKLLTHGVRLGVVLLLIVWLLRSCRWQEFARVWCAADSKWWLLAVTLFALHIGMSWLALIRLVRRHGKGPPPVSQLMEFGYVHALASFTPARVGEVLLLKSAKRWQIEPVDLFAALMIQRLTSLLVVGGTACVFATRYVAGASSVMRNAVVLMAGVAFIGVLGVGALQRHRHRRWLNPLLSRVDMAAQALVRMLRSRPGRLAQHSALVLVRFLVHVAATYLVLLSLGGYVSISVWLGVASLVALAGMVPVSIGGFGVTEVTLVVLLKPFGITPELAISFAVVARGLTLLTRAVWCSAHLVVNVLSTRAREPETPCFTDDNRDNWRAARLQELNF